MQQQQDFYIPKQKYFGQSIKQYKTNSTQNEAQPIGKSIIISGFPYDEGTKRNGGRIGGAIASKIFRQTLKNRQLYMHKAVNVYDSGDINSQMILEDAHIQLYEKHKKLFMQNSQIVLFSIGGSNDQSYPNIRSLLQSYPNSKIGVINLDAHFDVRPLKQGKDHSGSPFRQMLQNQLFIKNQCIFIQFGCKGATCSNQHYKYLQDKNSTVYWLQKNIRTFETSKQSQYLTQAGQLFYKILSQLRQKVQYIFVSFDTDSINSKYMPGVSAPSVVGGLSSAQAIEIMRISGLEGKVKLVDFSEFNPAVESLISSRMLTQMFYTFSMAFSERGVK